MAGKQARTHAKHPAKKKAAASPARGGKTGAPQTRGKRAAFHPHGKKAPARAQSHAGSRGAENTHAPNARGSRTAPVRHAGAQTRKRAYGQEKHSAQSAPSRPRSQQQSLCPVSDRCGACQHIDEPYNLQLRRKDKAISALFGEAGLLDDAVSVRPILGMDDPFHYRDKVISPFVPGHRISGRPADHRRADAPHDGRGPHGRHPSAGSRADRAARAGRYEILTGMYEAHSHTVVPTDGCLIENERATQVIEAIRRLMPRFGIEPYREDDNTGFLRHAVVRCAHESGEVLVTLVTNGDEFPASRAFCRELTRRCPFVTTVVQNVNTRQTNVILGERERRLYGPGFILDTLCGLTFRISSQSFYQVNARQTEVLYRTAVDLASLDGTQDVIDAYCGTGTIGLVAASMGARSVVGVDAVGSAIEDARENARHNGVENARFVADDAGAFMRREAAAGNACDVAFLDPPRSGSDVAFLDALCTLAPQCVVYISCNPKTQVRDIAYLKARGYRLDIVQPVDMFPHTDHIECVARLSRAGDKRLERSGGEGPACASGDQPAVARDERPASARGERFACASEGESGQRGCDERGDRK